jgi:cytochrome c oxidase subunit IV
MVKFVSSHNPVQTHYARTDHRKQLRDEPVEEMLVEAPPASDASSTAGAAEEYHRSPDALYFGIGIATFLVALALFATALTKRNYLEDVAGAVLSQDNPQDDEANVTASVSLNPEHLGNSVKFRLQQVLVAWIFIVASISFFLDYLAQQASFNKACHWFGMVAASLWLVGFLIHFHWQLSVNSRREQLLAAVFKVMGCIMMQVHPFCMIIGMSEHDEAVWWPSFTCLALWHIGNIIGCGDVFFHPPNGFNRNAGVMAYCNLVVTEMWIDQFATWLLLFASVSITEWGGNPKDQLLPRTNGAVIFCEFTGTLMFLLAACIRCEWCNGFRNCTHKKLSEPEAAVSSSSASDGTS